MNEQLILRVEQLFRCHDRMKRTFMREAFDRQGLSELSNPELLIVLHHQPRGSYMTQKEIADFIGISPPTAAVSIQRMEKAGLVKKVADEKDLRKNRIMLTHKGNDLVERCHRAGQNMQRILLEGFADEELELLCSYLLRMVRNMEEMGVRSPEHIREKVEG